MCIRDRTGGEHAIGAVSAAPWGSASILPISAMYVLMMGGEGLTQATKIAIRGEIDEIASGKLDKQDNPLKNAPHTMEVVVADGWSRRYSRERAAFPLPWVRERKFWPAVGRVDNAFGDRNLICSCPPIEEYATAEA